MSASPEDRRPALRGEDLILTLLCTAAGPLLWWFGSTGLDGAPAHGGIHLVERLVASLCAGAGTVVAGWWLTALLGTAVAAVGYRLQSVRLARIGRVLSPVFLRRVAASVLGMNLLLAPSAWADAGSPVDRGAATQGSVTREASEFMPTTLPRPGWLSPVSVSSSTDNGTSAAASSPTPGARRGQSSSAKIGTPGEPDLPTPTWKPAVPVPSAPGAPRSAQPVSDDVKTATVRHGDCLWDIAANELGPTATDLEIDRRWRQWHEHNRTVIGNDADLLVPGTVLAVPPLA